MHMQSYLQNAFVIFHTQKIAIFFENDTTDNKKSDWRNDTKSTKRRNTREKTWRRRNTEKMKLERNCKWFNFLCKFF